MWIAGVKGLPGPRYLSGNLISGPNDVLDVGVCSEIVELSIWEYVFCDAFPTNDVVFVDKVRLDLGVFCELDIESCDDADQNELCGELGCGALKCCCTKLKSCTCCLVG